MKSIEEKDENHKKVIEQLRQEMIAKDSKISESEVELKKREKQIQELQEEIKIFEKGLTDQNDIFTKKFQ